jgi:hypothetical protein
MKIPEMYWVRFPLCVVGTSRFNTATWRMEGFQQGHRKRQQRGF